MKLNHSSFVNLVFQLNNLFSLKAQELKCDYPRGCITDIYILIFDILFWFFVFILKSKI